MDDVLVVGAGPVGLTMAAELARHGVRPRIVDRLVEPLPYCRAIGVTPRTLEVYDDMGIAREMVDAGLFLEGLRVALPDAPARDMVPDFSDLPYGPIAIRQPETERILSRHLAGFGIRPERGVALIALTQDVDGVAVTLEDAEGRREEARFRYVVGCDGAHSAVRHALGIAFEGEAFPMGFMLGEVTMEADLPRGFAFRAMRPREGDAPEMFVAVPLPEKNRYRVSTLAPPDATNEGTEHGLQSERPGPTLAELQAVADRLLAHPVVLSDLGWSSYFRISMRLAARYRVGRAFIAGDAAHIHPPTGGLGMNTGIQDAYNLAWKLALVLTGAAPESLLDSYEAERRPVGADVVARTRAASVSLGREAEKPHRLADTQILVSYRDSAIVGERLEEQPHEAAPRAGDRAPDAMGLTRDHLEFTLRLHDMLRGPAHVLIVHLEEGDTAAAASAVEQLSARLARVFGDHVRVVAIGDSDSTVGALLGVPLLRDIVGSFAAAYQPTRDTAYLVRPDGYIAYHARPWTEDGIVAALGQTLGLGLR